MQYLFYAVIGILGFFIFAFAAVFITRAIGRAWFRSRWEMWNVYKQDKKENDDGYTSQK